MNHQKPITKAVRSALLGSAALAISLTSNTTLAADEVPEEDDVRLVVTGSRLKGTDLENANPVTIIDREDLLNTSATNVGEFLQTLPAVSGSPLGTRTNNGGNGAVTVDIRGLGAARTLVLVNGHRVVDGGDLQTVPLTLVERVEILKDGASTIYGADAVAGVVNIITRKDYEGLEISAEIAGYENVSGEDNRYRLGLITGGSFDKGSISFGVEWDKQHEIFQGDTDYDQFLFPLFVQDTSTFSLGSSPSASDPTFIEFGSSRTPQGIFDFNGQTLILIEGRDGTSPSDYRPAILSFVPNNDLWNFAPVVYLQTPFERLNLFLQGNYDVNDHFNFYADARFNKRESSQILAPLPYDTAIFPGHTLPGGGNGVSAQNFYNPFGEEIVRARRRQIETGGREFNQDVQQFQTTLGLKGDINLNWDYDTTITYGTRTRIDTDFGQFSGARLDLALGPSGVDSSGNIVCGTPDANGVVASPIAGCVPLNLFGPVGSITPEMLNYVGVALNDRFDSELLITEATVTGELFELPGGYVEGAFGLGRRYESAKFIPDSAKVLGAVTGGIATPTDGNFSTTYAYAEFNVPLARDLAFAKNLDLNIGFRLDDNSIFGEETTSGAKIRWEPIDGLLLRGTYSDVFRAPGIGTLLGGQARGASPNTIDPCSSQQITDAIRANCVAQGVPSTGWNQQDSQVTSTGGSNPDVLPETGDTTTLGIAWSPDFVENVSVTLDWWKIDLEGAINTLTALEILTQCATSLEPSACASIQRDVSGNLTGNPGAVTNVFSIPQNVATETAEGIDLGLTYSLPTDNWGGFKFRVLYTHLLERTFTPFDGADPVELEGTYNTGLDASYPTDKAKFNVGWSLGDWSANWTTDWIDSIDVDFAFFPAESYSTDNQFYHDAQVNYTIPGWDSVVTLGVLNITDEDPVFLDSGFNASTDEGTFRTFGRSWYVRFTHTF